MPVVTFRRLTIADVPQLHRWLNEPGVVRWWEGDDVSYDAVVRDYANPDDPTEHWIASAGGRDVGWIQCYAVADNLEEDEVRQWLALGVDRTGAGIDYLIAEPAQRGRGLGSTMIRAFVDQIVFGQHPQWTQVCASPRADNVASWRALEKAGFTFRGEFDDPLGRCRLMVASRPSPPARSGHDGQPSGG